MIYTSPFGERCFAQIQPDLLTIQNSGGVWNSGGAQYIRITEDSLKITPDEPKVAPNIKHGTASELARLSARKSAQFSLNAPIAPSGVAAVPPDIDVMLQAVFGGAGQLVSGTTFGNAWSYQIHDRQSVPLTLLGFQHLSAATGNRYILGAVPSRMSIDFNGNILGMSIDGVGVAAMENESFGLLPNGDTVPNGGLGSFPSEPGSFTANGGLINAFGGQLFINNQLVSLQCDSLSVEYQTGIGLKGNFVDTAYPAAVVYNKRSAMVTLGFVNNDSTVLAQIKVLARKNTPVPIEFYLGSVSGYRCYVKLNGVQLVPGTLTDAQGYVTCSFGQSASSVSAGFANDIELGFA